MLRNCLKGLEWGKCWIFANSLRSLYHIPPHCITCPLEHYITKRLCQTQHTIQQTQTGGMFGVYTLYFTQCYGGLISLDRSSVLLLTRIILRLWALRPAVCWHPVTLQSPEIPWCPDGLHQTALYQWQPGLGPARCSAWVSPQIHPRQNPRAVRTQKHWRRLIKLHVELNSLISTGSTCGS